MALRSVSRELGGSASSAVKVLRVLELVATSSTGSLSELLEKAQLPKSTLLRLLSTLVEEGYLERPAQGHYRGALKLWRLGCGAVDYANVREHVLPQLRQLVAETEETAHYAVYEAGRATYVEKVDGSHPIRSYTSIGSSSPAYATATGKALLAWQPEYEIRRVLAHAEAFNASTVTGVDQYLAAAEEIRRDGFAVNRGEWRLGVWGVAAPIFDRHGEAIAAVGVSGPQDRVAPNVTPFSFAVVRAATQLSTFFGWAGPE